MDEYSHAASIEPLERLLEAHLGPAYLEPAYLEPAALAESTNWRIHDLAVIDNDGDDNNVDDDTNNNADDDMAPLCPIPAPFPSTKGGSPLTEAPGAESIRPSA